MGWIAGLGAAVVGFFSTTAAAFTGVTMAVGGAIVGAGIGALYSAVTGGDILQGALFGVVGGAVVGFGASLAGFGAAPSVGQTAGAAAGTAATVEYGVTGGQALGTGTSILGSSAGSTFSFANTAGSLFGTKEGWAAVGGVASLGSAFLKGGAQLDPDAVLAHNEDEAAKNRASAEKIASDRNEATLGAAAIGLQGTREQIASNEKQASEQLAFAKEKFKTEFEEDQWRDRDDREEVKRGRERFEAGVKEASKYVTSNTQTVSLVESSRRRKNLPGPSWWTTNNQQQQPEENQQQQSTGILSMQPAAGAA